MSDRLVVRGVAKHWTLTSGLRPVSFAAEAGTLVAVRGRSGSGKSTLIAIAAGWCTPDEGEVLLDGETVVDRALPWHDVAIVPQVFALPNELTIAEAVLDAAGDRAVHVGELLEALDLTAVAARPPDMLSMGQQQRAAVARALVASPRLLLADEPTSHQDPHHIRLVTDALLAATAAGTTVVVASHDHHVVDRATLVVDLTV